MRRAHRRQRLLVRAGVRLVELLLVRGERLVQILPRLGGALGKLFRLRLRGLGVERRAQLCLLRGELRVRLLAAARSKPRAAVRAFGGCARVDKLLARRLPYYEG